MSIDSRDERLYSFRPSLSGRSESELDCDYILYSSAFRRLAWVSQVVSPREGDFFHTRLTHALKVAQLGKRLAQKFVRSEDPELLKIKGGLNPDVVEAAGLAHDLGHPPFGHVGEQVLLDLIESFGPPEFHNPNGFEGNAQSFRVVSRLSYRSGTFKGLNLTRATLNALLKYPWMREAQTGIKSKKWGAYFSDKESFAFARQGKENDVKGLEAEIMDWADDITYSVHDLEDFYRAGLIPLEKMSGFGFNAERDDFFSWNKERWIEIDRKPEEFDPYVAHVSDFFDSLPINTPFDGTTPQKAALRIFTADSVGRFASHITINQKEDARAPAVDIDLIGKLQVMGLKDLIWRYVILRPSLAMQQRSQGEILKQLYSIFRHACEKRKDWKLFPVVFRKEIERIEKEVKPNERRYELSRSVVDMLSGLTEYQVYDYYQRLTGHKCDEQLHIRRRF